MRVLEEMSKGDNIVKWIKGQRISWLSHLRRMEEDRMPTKIFTQDIEGSRRRGRPRKSWRQLVEKNGRTLFDRPNSTVGCSANGRRRRRRSYVSIAKYTKALCGQNCN